MRVDNLLAKAANWRPKDLPIGKALVLLLFASIPGKLTTKLVRLFLGKVLGFGVTKTTVAGLNVYQWSNIVGPVVGLLEAWGYNSRFIRKALGDVGADALAVGTIYGSIDAGFERGGITKMDTDLTDIISNAIRDKVAVALPAALPTVTSGASPSRKTALGSFPERSSAAFTGRGEQDYAGPALGNPARDPIADIEKTLEQMSQL